MKVVKLIVRIIFGLMFINAGLNKFFMYMPMPELTEEQIKIFSAFNEITWLFPLVAIVEIVGGILFIIPRTRLLGAMVILPVMVGILLHHMVLEPEGLILTAVFFVINIWVILENKERLKLLIL
ncbi:DoxX family membrane protein [Mesonia sp. K7]|uniref:DoxX family membrane protein n=1 Tax=Mesonia sp. K7 TaxID=2218606 RepID=UPI000DAA6A8B|nr:DoxX family membrane protein [Mesonia sp. K7]PZD77000.1 DoxX family protein [Mesonia sp. K7]